MTTMGNACRPFGLDEDNGMRVFSIVEMFLAFYHIVTASYVYRNAVEYLYTKSQIEDVGINDGQKVVLALSVVFTLTLCLQAVLGFLMYIKGWKEKNGLVCYSWVVVAITNNMLSIMIAVTEIANGGIDCWVRLQLYLLYVFYGGWVIRCFLNWAKNEGFDSVYCCKPRHRASTVSEAEVVYVASAPQTSKSGGGGGGSKSATVAVAAQQSPQPTFQQKRSSMASAGTAHSKMKGAAHVSRAPRR